jgi:hypothetical protein
LVISLIPPLCYSPQCLFGYDAEGPPAAASQHAEAAQQLDNALRAARDWWRLEN